MYFDQHTPTTYPYGRFYLYQKNPFSPVRISGWMRRMPPPSSYHGFAINEKAVTQPRQCKTAGRHWNPTNEFHGEMNNMTYHSHVGNLKPIKDTSSGYASYFAAAERPTMYGSQNIQGKAMTIYEKPDDLGLAGTFDSINWGSAGKPIACCNIRGYQVTKYELEV